MDVGVIKAMEEDQEDDFEIYCKKHQKLSKKKSEQDSDQSTTEDSETETTIKPSSVLSRLDARISSLQAKTPVAQAPQNPFLKHPQNPPSPPQTPPPPPKSPFLPISHLPIPSLTKLLTLTLTHTPSVSSSPSTSFTPWLVTHQSKHPPTFQLRSPPSGDYDLSHEIFSDPLHKGMVTDLLKDLEISQL